MAFEMAELAHALGPGAGTAHHSPIRRTLRRLVGSDLGAGVGGVDPVASEAATWSRCWTITGDTTTVGPG